MLASLLCPIQLSQSSFFLPASPRALPTCSAFSSTNTPVNPDHSYHLGLLLPILSRLFLPKDKSVGRLNLFCGSMRVDMPATRFLESSPGSVVVLALENLPPSGIVPDL